MRIVRVPERKPYRQGRDRSDHKPQQISRGVRCSKPYNTSSEYQPDPRIYHEDQISVHPAIADRFQRANAIVIGEVHERVSKSTQVRNKENSERPERSPERIVSQTKSAIHEHEYHGQRRGKEREAENPVSESAMIFQVAQGAVFDAAENIYVGKI